MLSPWKEPLRRWAGSRVRRPWLILSLALATATMGAIGLQFVSSEGTASPVWPSTGLAIAALLVLPEPEAWLGIALGALATELLSAAPPGVVIAATAGSVLEAIVGASLIRRAVEQRVTWGPLASIFGVIIAAALATMIAATLGAGSLALAGVIPPATAGRAWLTWWTGDAVGALLLAPTVLAFRLTATSERPWTARRAAESAALGVATAAVCGSTFLLPAGVQTLYLVFPLLLWAATRFGARGTYVTVLAISAISVAATLLGRGPFVATHTNASLLQLQVFLAALAVTAMGLATFAVRRRLMLPFAVLLGGWLLSGWLFSVLRVDQDRFDTAHFDKSVQEVERTVTENLDEYGDFVREAAAYVSGAPRLTAADWRRYVRSTALDERFPGLVGLGLVVPVPRAKLARFVDSVRVSGTPDFRVRAIPGSTPTRGAEALVLRLIEPAGTGAAAVGLDLGSEPTRRAAAERSRDLGRPVLTKRLSIVHDERAQPGYLLMAPFYRNAESPRTVAARRGELRGWISAPLVFESFFADATQGHAREVRFSMFVGDATSEENPLLDDVAGRRAPGPFEKETHVVMLGQRFTLGWNRTAAFVPVDRTASTLLGTTTSLLTLLLAGLVMNLQSAGAKAGALVERRTRELQASLGELERSHDQIQRQARELEAARDAALAASRAKSDFLATMSHEIRTPMNGVMGMTELLLHTPMHHEQRDYAETIQQSASSLLGILNDILDFSKMEAGKLEISPAAFDLRRTIEDAAELLSAATREKHLDLIVRIAPGTPCGLIGDAGRLRQILLNLLGNAVKFTRTGHVRLDAACLGIDDGVARVRFTVEDTGIGIPESYLPTLFTKFSQADASTTRRFGGTGLGLAISRQLTELMGGRIDVRSIVDEGTTMGVEIPLPVDARFAPWSPPSEIAGAQLLVAGDATAQRAVAAETLGSWGAEVHLAATVAEAADAAHHLRLDAILVVEGVVPWETDGTARLVHRLHQGPPIVLASGLARAGRASREDRAALAAQLSLPARHEQLASALGSVLHNCAGDTPPSGSPAHGRRETPHDETPAAPRPEAPASGVHALLAEDNAVNQLIARKMLELLGCRVDVAADGSAAVDAFRREHYDIVFMDCQMPTMDGYEATAALRAFESARGGERTPIVALTANVMAGDRERSLACGMDDHIGKPLVGDELRLALERWTRGAIR